MKKNEPTYEQAMKRLEDIVGSLERDALELDQLAVRIKEARELMAFCRERLQKVETDVKKILEDGKE